MSERKHPLAKCEECPWRDLSGYADATGPEDAKILIVGEAPGAVETQTGIPFTGPSGQLLDRVLQHHGIARHQVRLTNVAACHPPYRPGSGSVVPPKEVVHACKPRLDDELRGRDSVVLLGNTAAQTVLETTTGILALRQGPPKGLPRNDSVKVIPTVHPAACLRQGDLFPNMVKDIGKLVDRGVKVKWVPPEWKSTEDPHEAMAWLRQLSTFDTLAIDIEVGISKELMAAPGAQLLCIGISYAPDKAVVLGEQACKDERVRRGFRDIMSHKKLICHNGKFDIAQLTRMGWLNDTYSLYFDTMLASYTLDERPGYHSLGLLGMEVLGAPDWKSVTHKYTGKDGSYALIPRPILYEYCAYDISNTFLLYKYFERRLEKEGMRKVHDMLVYYAIRLMVVEMEGVAFDLEYNQYLFDHFEESLQPLERRMAELGLMNPRSPQQVKAWLHDQGVRVMDTQAETLRNVFAKAAPDTELYELLLLLLKQRLDQKSYSTYVKGMRKRVHDGRIYGTFNLHGSVTGRTASRNPNLQNVTRGVVLRKQFIPDSGNVFVQCDYGQIELRVAALEAEDEYLIGVFNDPSRDIFDEIGTRLYGSLEAARLKVNRVRTKAYVYGMNYGREAYSIAQEYKIPVPEAEKGMQGFFSMVPGIVAWRKSIELEVKKQALQTRFGRKRRFWLVTKDNRMDVYKEALAFVPQSTANDVNLHALCRMVDKGYHVRIPVHDSIMVECAEADRRDVASDMTKIMKETACDLLGDRVPFPADAEFGTNWGELSEED